MRQHWDTLSRIPDVERAVSRSLRDIRIVHRRFQPTVLAEDYEVNLRQLVTSIGDYKGRVGFPKHWPEKLTHLQLVVESCVPQKSSFRFFFTSGVAWRYGARTSPKEVPRSSPRTAVLFPIPLPPTFPRPKPAWSNNT
jgi:hypothetical protein